MALNTPGIEPESATPPDAQEKLPISVAIITLDEEQNIGATLESVKWAEEIVVVDSGSVDRTIEICREAGARVEHHAWQGFSKQKNTAIDLCTRDWVLSLDADERVSPALAEEIRSLFETGPACDGYFIPRMSLFLGRWMMHCGWWPDFAI